jgi:uncharacterized protein
MSVGFVRALLVLAALLSSVASAQAAGKRYALLVGVKEYEHADFSNLKYTENDAEELAKVLTDAKYDEVVVLTATRGKKDKSLLPTAKNVRDQLKKLSDKVKRDDLLLVGLAGHGLTWAVLDGETKKEKDESFFCPSDARPRGEQTLDELKKTMIPLGELFRTLDESGAGVRLLLVDACRNEAKGQRRNVDVDNLPRTKKGTAVLFSCKSGEVAHETAKLGKGHGVFFYHVIEGLNDKAKDRRGAVTWTGLAEYVIDRVTEDVPEVIGGGAKQTPHKIENVEGRSPVLLQIVRNDEGEKLFREGMDSYYGLTGEIDDARALKLFRQAAAKGHALAGGYAGVMLCFGMGGDRDQAEGLKQIKQSLPAMRKKAEEGDVEAQTLLGECYDSGLGLKKDHEEAVRWFRKAADRGDGPAMNSLGVAYSLGQGVKKDPVEAARWYRKAADEGGAMAMTNLGSLYYEGRGVKKDPEEAVRWFRKAIEKGNTLAMKNLAAAYHEGQGVKKDDKEATKWYRKAAERGDTKAAYVVGVCYVEGRGVKQDYKEAARWYRKAADKDFAPAMSNLGWLYETGNGVDKDAKEAVTWYKKAADKGDAAGMNNLGAAYARGVGVKEDRKEAVKWFRKAAEQGIAESMLALGAAYETGKGVGKNDKLSVEWYRKAAAEGNAAAMEALGQAYEVGRGVPKNRAEALRWYKKAAALGDEDAKEKVKELEGK